MKKEIKFYCNITKKWETLVVSKPYKKELKTK